MMITMEGIATTYLRARCNVKRFKTIQLFHVFLVR